jgi:Kef-type K+ transport system membrane component KefB
LPGTYPKFWILVAAVAAPLLSEIPLGIRMPIVVIEVILGVVIGPHALNLVHFDGFIVTMFTLAMATTLFMGGMELNFGEIRGRPLSLAVGGWSVSLFLGIAVVVLLRIIPQVHAPLMVTLGLCTTGLGVMIPVFRASGQLGTPFGRLFLAAGTLGEIGPIVAMSLLLSQQYSTWQEVGFLCAFLAIVGATVIVGMRAREPQMATLLSRHTHVLPRLGCARRR